MLAYMLMNLWAIIVAAGKGTRFKAQKQLVELEGKRVIDYSVDLFLQKTKGVIVVGGQDLNHVETKGCQLISGGSTRAESVRCGLGALTPEVDYVLIHDGARPLVSSELIDRVVEALKNGHKAVVPVVPVSDTLRHNGKSVDRELYVAAQTPQGFEKDTIIKAHQAQFQASDDATVVDMLGIPVEEVKGEVNNLKITNPSDLAIAEEILNG